MDPLTSNSLSGAGGGFIGVLAGWFGFRARICGIEKRIETLAKSVRYEDTCEKICDANIVRLDSIEKMQKEMRLDIKTLLTKIGELNHG